MLTWMNGDKGYEGKWSKKQTEEISLLLINTNKELPSDIHRSVRSLKDIAFWKGTEFRTILLYVGMVVLQNYLPKDVYNHFLLLTCAVTICSIDEYRPFMPKVHEMFEEYVEMRKELYGFHSISSNFHNLIHITEDIKRFGNLEETTTYEFENILGQMKSRIKSYKKPLQQIARRLVEISTANDNTIDFNNEFVPAMKYQIKNLIGICAFRDITIRNNILISNRKFGDKWVLTTENEIIEMIYAFALNGQFFLRSRRVIDKSDFFAYPFSSRYINIFQSKLNMGNTIDLKIEMVKAKIICLSAPANVHVFIPLLHSF